MATYWPGPGFAYTDCSKIKAGDDLTVQAADLRCQPDNHAEVGTLDCSTGTSCGRVWPYAVCEKLLDLRVDSKP